MTVKTTKPVQKATKKTIKKVPKKSAQQNVIITPLTQKLFIAAAIVAWLSGLGMVVYYLVGSAEFTNLTFWWYQLGYSVFPLLLLAIAWWYVGRIGTTVNRLFKSLLITVAAMAVFYGAYSLVISIFLRSWGANPGWWSVHGSEVITYAAFTTMYVVGLVGMKLRRGSRG
ncbi:hypothetical protein EYC59_04175 [Candidatus Saccharibacteria bacterium]|nr:MAG: hypothetical protein EYC59_04175 [Candidatus Saccharibacteria bacterium]